MQNWIAYQIHALDSTSNYKKTVSTRNIVGEVAIEQSIFLKLSTENYVEFVLRSEKRKNENAPSTNPTYGKVLPTERP